MLRQLIAKWKRLMREKAEANVDEPGSPGFDLYALSEVEFEDLYPVLKGIARKHMGSERTDHTLQPTALIHELYLQLMQRPDFRWTDRSHFLVYASRAMRHLLVDHARKRRAAKRQPDEVIMPTGALPQFVDPRNLDDILAIDQALSELAAQDPRKASVVELRFFAGLNFIEIGEVLKITDRTAKRDWALAEAWLAAKLGRR